MILLYATRNLTKPSLSHQNFPLAGNIPGASILLTKTSDFEPLFLCQFLITQTLIEHSNVILLHDLRCMLCFCLKYSSRTANIISRVLVISSTDDNSTYYCLLPSLPRYSVMNWTFYSSCRPCRQDPSTKQNPQLQPATCTRERQPES